MPGELMRAEIAEQPAVLAAILDAAPRDLRAVARAVAARRPRSVVLAARGSSDHAALYGSYLVQLVLGLPAGLASMSVVTVYDAVPDLREVWWIAVSQSGGSSDLVESTRAARAAGATTLAVTNDAASALAGVAELHLDVLAGPERSVAATKSYTAQLLTLHLLLHEVAGRGEAGLASARGLPALVERSLDADGLAGVTAELTDADTLVAVSRGVAYATAREGALKLAETASLFTTAYSTADLMHGPVAVLQPGRTVLGVVPPGRAGPAVREALDVVRRTRATVVAVGAGAPGRGLHLRLPDVDELLAPVAQVVPLQQLALELALARGHDPDRPRGLRKVTDTR